MVMSPNFKSMSRIKKIQKNCFKSSGYGVPNEHIVRNTYFPYLSWPNKMKLIKIIKIIEKSAIDLTNYIYIYYIQKFQNIEL